MDHTKTISKQKDCFQLPQTFIVNGEKVSSSVVIAHQYYHFFAEMSKSVHEYVPLPTASFHSHLEDRLPFIHATNS